MTKKQNYITYNGKRLRLSEWCTMAQKAKDLDKSEGYVRKLVWLKRKGKEQPIEFLDIPELNLTIVKR